LLLPALHQCCGVVQHHCNHQGCCSWPFTALKKQRCSGSCCCCSELDLLTPHASSASVTVQLNSTADVAAGLKAAAIVATTAALAASVDLPRHYCCCCCCFLAAAAAHR
jgi:hypothetical protein